MLSKLLRNSWWVFLFLGAVSLLYFHGMRQKEIELEEAAARLEALEIDKETALEQKRELELQMSSQNDPAWIEMTLMKHLGVAPEGKQKVYFEKEP